MERNGMHFRDSDCRSTPGKDNMDFIETMKSDWKWRTIDFIGHVILAIILPGKWWLQFFPDILVPVLFIHGWKTGKLLPKDNLLIKIHNDFHSVGFPALVLCLSFFFYRRSETNIVGLLLGCHWLAHIMLDGYTHKLDWHKKGIW